MRSRRLRRSQRRDVRDRSGGRPARSFRASPLVRPLVGLQAFVHRVARDPQSVGNRRRTDLSDPRREVRSQVLAALIGVGELRDPPSEGSLLVRGELALRTRHDLMVSGRAGSRMRRSWRRTCSVDSAVRSRWGRSDWCDPGDGSHPRRPKTGRLDGSHLALVDVRLSNVLIGARARVPVLPGRRSYRRSCSCILSATVWLSDVRPQHMAAKWAAPESGHRTKPGISCRLTRTNSTTSKR